MENQLIREQVFDVLFNYVKIADGIFTESDCATVRDEICLRIDQSQFTADEAEDYINQEVEKRIAEKMPSEEEWIDIKDRMPESGQCVLIYSHSGGVAEGAWLSSKNHFEQWRWSAVLNDVTHWFIDVFLNNSEKYHNKIDKK